jgi:Acyl-CoA carboxylase epsilon subunit
VIDIRVEKGRPTAEELAAVVAALLSRPSAPPPAPKVSRWAASARPGRRRAWR